ncbi:hypothetical protein VPH35_058526 [Triticum aestivum]
MCWFLLSLGLVACPARGGIEILHGCLFYLSNRVGRRPHLLGLPCCRLPLPISFLGPSTACARGSCFDFLLFLSAVSYKYCLLRVSVLHSNCSRLLSLFFLTTGAIVRPAMVAPAPVRSGRRRRGRPPGIRAAVIARVRRAGMPISSADSSSVTAGAALRGRLAGVGSGRRSRSAAARRPLSSRRAGCQRSDSPATCSALHGDNHVCLAVALHASARSFFTRRRWQRRDRIACGLPQRAARRSRSRSPW